MERGTRSCPCILSPTYHHASLCLVGVDRLSRSHERAGWRFALCHVEWHRNGGRSDKYNHRARRVPRHSLCPASCRASEVRCTTAFVKRRSTPHSSHTVWPRMPPATICKCFLHKPTLFSVLTHLRNKPDVFSYGEHVRRLPDHKYSSSRWFELDSQTASFSMDLWGFFPHWRELHLYPRYPCWPEHADGVLAVVT